MIHPQYYDQPSSASSLDLEFFITTVINNTWDCWRLKYTEVHTVSTHGFHTTTVINNTWDYWMLKYTEVHTVSTDGFHREDIRCTKEPHPHGQRQTQRQTQRREVSENVGKCHLLYNSSSSSPGAFFLLLVNLGPAAAASVMRIDVNTKYIALWQRHADRDKHWL